MYALTNVQRDLSSGKQRFYLTEFLVDVTDLVLPLIITVH